MELSSPVICIVGPTASGKSDLAQRIALEVDGEVVSADSMQVYRGMDIGTGKLLPEERLVVHHGLDLVDPGDPFSAALFQEYARSCFADIDARGKRIVLCGGTGFYVRAAVDDFEFPAGEQIGNETRTIYNELAQKHGPLALWNMLSERDPESARLIPPNDVKRVVRAFELLEEGTSYAHQKEGFKHIGSFAPVIMIGLHVDPAVLRARIDARVDSMFQAGFVSEVERLLEQGFREGITAPQAIGYKEVVAALDGKITMQEARERMQTATRQYAKRQRTWFRKDNRIVWINATLLEHDDIARAALDILKATEVVRPGRSEAEK